jgi:hypothetical protein
MDKSLRTPLRNTVTSCRKLLEGAISERLEGQFGVFQNGKIEETDQLGHLSAEDQEYRKQLIIHLEHIKAEGIRPKEAAEQLIREVAFTHLNRLCAFKLMEARGLIRESVSKSVKSQGFFFYLADHPEDESLANAGEIEKAYRHFLGWLSETLSNELGALFAEDDPANRLYPPQRVLDQVLDLLNAPELKEIWTEDETIGWVYQYFTPKELRDQARKESAAPRNSYELAFRNQFYTPRYVVEFLTDNTLGRTWYEMRQGKTRLAVSCKYLVRQPHEVWLNEGDTAPILEAGEEKNQEKLLNEAVYIPFRAIKDPRDLKILDPACGSGHFLLYCFDLLTQIYTEAWEDGPEVFIDLRGDLGCEEFLRQVPSMILQYNLYGIDIDLRATQIASLALWLRAQRSYQEIGLKQDQRPRITRSNIVCAEPMPGEEELLEEFTQTLNPPLIGQLVKTVFNKMKLAGEAGSLLRIEDELRDAIQAAKKQMDEQPSEEQLAFWPTLSKPKQLIFNLSGIQKTDEQFWNTLEGRVLIALKNYANQASNGKGYKRKLFAEDAARGFAFVDICRRKYDLVLMNPPFGACTKDTESWIKNIYPKTYSNLGTAFIQRASSFLIDDGSLGIIIDSATSVRSSYSDYRYEVLYKNYLLSTYIHLGWEVLDANVEVCCFTGWHKLLLNEGPQIFCVDASKASSDHKANLLKGCVNSYSSREKRDSLFLVFQHEFKQFPNGVPNFTLLPELRQLFLKFSALGKTEASVKTGMSSGDNERFYKLFWETPITLEKRWIPLSNGGEFSPFYRPFQEVVYWNQNGEEIKNNPGSFIRNESVYFKPGLSYGKRGNFLSIYTHPSGRIITNEGQGIFLEHDSELFEILGIINSSICRSLINEYCGQHKENGYVSLLPIPEIAPQKAAILRKIVSEIVLILRSEYRFDLENMETVGITKSLLQNGLRLDNDYYKILKNHLDCLENKLEQEVVSLYNLSDEAYQYLKNKSVSCPTIYQAHFSEFSQKDYFCKKLFDYIVGLTFGRWNIDFSTAAQIPPTLKDPFEELPINPPGMLQTALGLPIASNEIRRNYPITVAWDGILVDDSDHPKDIITYVRDVLEIFFPVRAEITEQEACQVLDVRSLREYFRKSGNGGFWMDHVKRYSKSRRKAPIYWLLQSSHKNYAVWLYYHRLDKDLLFKALTQYVEPKIRLEEERLKSLRTQRSQFGTGGKQAKDMDKDLESQEDLLVELEDFRDKLRRAADLGLEPDLNDGVVLNIAPLWELVPWGEAKKYWEELLEGKYEWSSIGKQLWLKGMVK